MQKPEIVIIKISTNFPHWPLQRQTPSRSGQWSNCRFYINEPVEHSDYWVVFDGLTQEEHTRCSPENTILITAEPPDIKRYHPEFLNQFATIITAHREIVHPNLIYTQQSLPWMIGGRYQHETGSWTEFTKDYDELSAIKNYQKDKLISVIVSGKTKTPGQRQRLAFVDKLKAHFGDDLDIFGREINPISDKWDGLVDYKYTLALENSTILDYWTEKLADPFLAGVYPFYWGCPNIFDYFSEGSLTEIDIQDAERSIRIIEDEVNKNRYEQAVNEISKAKNLVLNRYNFFPSLCDYCCQKAPTSRSVMLALKPERTFFPKPRFYHRNKILRGIRKMYSRANQ